MPDLSIGDVARRAGLRTSAIRYYEKMGCCRARRAFVANADTTRKFSSG
jgi:hypothetical protein